MKTIIRAQFAGVISTGAFENEKPLFEITEEHDKLLTAIAKREIQQGLYAICKDNFIKVQRMSLEEKLKLEQAGIRLYPIVDKNKEYPSVTSITGWDTDFNMPDTELEQYGARGTLVHKLCEHYDDYVTGTGAKNQWLSLNDLVVQYPNLYPDYVLMAKGSRNLNADGYCYPAFLKKYPIRHAFSEQVVYNHKYEYAGRVDKIGHPILNDAWKKLNVKEVNTVFDFKTSQQITEKYHWQLSAYAKAFDLDIQQAIIIPLRNFKDVKQGFSTPVVVDIEKSWEQFKVAREIFRKRFGI